MFYCYDCGTQLGLPTTGKLFSTAGGTVLCHICVSRKPCFSVPLTELLPSQREALLSEQVAQRPLNGLLRKEKWNASRT